MHNTTFMMLADDPTSGPSQDLSWANVGLGLAFVFFNAVISQALGLGVGTSLVTAALRSVLQLSVLALVLKSIFSTQNPWAVAGLAGLLNVLGTIETVVNKAKMRHDWMFASVLFSMLGSIIPVSIIGARFAMSIQPFWTPERYIPVVGMLCGSTISGIVLSLNYVLKELHDNRDKIETYLAFGASRFEACRPIARDALRTALTPNVNQMSVLGLISIPGMMTGALLGGASVTQAARLQMVIMFMISACTSLSSIACTLLALSVVVDGDARVRSERVDARKAKIWRVRDGALNKIGEGVKSGWEGLRRRVKGRHGGEEEREDGGGERAPLLG